MKVVVNIAFLWAFMMLADPGLVDCKSALRQNKRRAAEGNPLLGLIREELLELREFAGLLRQEAKELSMEEVDEGLTPEAMEEVDEYGEVFEEIVELADELEELGKEVSGEGTP